MNHMTPPLIASLLALSAALCAGPAVAQPETFPSRPVRIVPFGTAGGPIDTIARM